MYAYICPDCGAYLDPGEVFDCRDKEKVVPSAPTPGTTAESRIFGRKFYSKNTTELEECQYGLLGNTPRA